MKKSLFVFSFVFSFFSNASEKLSVKNDWVNSRIETFANVEKARSKTSSSAKNKVRASILSGALTRNSNKMDNGLPLSNEWIISSFGEKRKIEMPLFKNMNIVIDEKTNSFSGSGGCNNIMGTLMLKGNKISFEKMAITMKACDNMAQELKFINALKAVNSYKIVGCELFLYKGRNKMLTLENCK